MDSSPEEDEELVSKVYKAQKLFPVKDDFVHQVIEDMEDNGLELNEANYSQRVCRRVCRHP